MNSGPGQASHPEIATESESHDTPLFQRPGAWATAGIVSLAALSALFVPRPSSVDGQQGPEGVAPVPLALAAVPEKAIPVTSAELEPHPDIPAQYLPPFKEVSSPELRAELKKGFERMFWLDHQASGAEYISILSDSLLNGGMSRTESTRTLVAVMNDGFLNFEQRREATARLGELFPTELGEWAAQRKARDNSSATGRVRAEVLGSDLLEEPGTPPQVEISCSQFTPGMNGVEASDRLVVQSKAVFVAAGLDPIEVSVARDLSFEVDKRGYLFQQHQTFTLAIPDALKRPDDKGSPRSFTMHLEYQVQPFRGTQAIGDKSVQGENWLLLTPLKDSPGGYSTTVVGVDGGALAHPEIPTTVARWMHIRAVLQQNSIKAAALGQKQATESQNALVGQPIASIDLVKALDAASRTLVIPQKGDVIIEFGATWCAPCKVIAPAVEKFAEAVRPLGAKVFRLSIDTEEARFAAALQAYPDGVITKDAAHSLSIDRVPQFIHIRDGKILTAETTTASRLDALKRALEGK